MDFSFKIVARAHPGHLHGSLWFVGGRLPDSSFFSGSNKRYESTLHRVGGTSHLRAKSSLDDSEI